MTDSILTRPIPKEWDKETIAELTEAIKVLKKRISDSFSTPPRDRESPQYFSLRYAVELIHKANTYIADANGDTKKVILLSVSWRAAKQAHLAHKASFHH